MFFYFEVETDLSHSVTCNCTICSKRAWTLIFVGEKDFKLLSGSEFLTDYQFAKKTIHHRFCKICGTSSYVDGSSPSVEKIFGVNLLCLDNVDLTKIKPTFYDGKNL